VKTTVEFDNEVRDYAKKLRIEKVPSKNQTMYYNRKKTVEKSLTSPSMI